MPSYTWREIGSWGRSGQKFARKTLKIVKCCFFKKIYFIPPLHHPQCPGWVFLSPRCAIQPPHSSPWQNGHKKEDPVCSKILSVRQVEAMARPVDTAVWRFPKKTWLLPWLLMKHWVVSLWSFSRLHFYAIVSCCQRQTFLMLFAPAAILGLGLSGCT